MTPQPIITSDTLKEWNTCKDGFIRFCELFPNGADLDTAVRGLIKYKHLSLAFWLINKAQKYNFCNVAALFVELSQDADAMVRINTADNINTPTEVLAELSRDNHVVVRGCIARNSNTPTEVLVELSRDNEAFVQMWIARNPNTPPEVLK